MTIAQILRGFIDAPLATVLAMTPGELLATIALGGLVVVVVLALVIATFSYFNG
jgi:hypothetical protein